MRPLLIVSPPIEPVSLSEMKGWLREDGGDEDTLIQALIVSARITLEAYTRRLFITQTWRMILDEWPRPSSSIAAPFAPFQSVSAIRVFDVNDAVQTIAPSTYRAPNASGAGRITFLTAPPTSGRSADGIEIDVVAGYGALATQTPEPLRRAIMMLAAHWREKRGDDPDDPLPQSVAQLAAPFRQIRLT